MYLLKIAIFNQVINQQKSKDMQKRFRLDYGNIMYDKPNIESFTSKLER